MSKFRDASKERYWRRLIDRQRRAEQTVAAFCARQGVPVHRFYWWKRTLRERDRPTRNHTFEKANRDTTCPTKEEVSSFVPVRFTFPIPAPIELIHPGGCVLRVPVGFDTQTFQQILAALNPATSNTGEK